MELTKEELELVRQWFNSVQDMNGLYLKHDDYVLAEKIYKALEISVPLSIIANKVSK